MHAMIRNSYPYRMAALLRGYVLWGQRKFEAPSPHFIKQNVLLRNSVSDAVWIETGTFRGQTTQLLAKYGTKVYSLEPEPTLYANAAKYFSTFDNVEIINGTSEDVFPKLLPTINGNLNFWLDGHFSAGPTFQGHQTTPILDELKSIGDNLHHFGKICVLVDDIRCFDPKNPKWAGYPSVDLVVDWARQHGLDWHIEHDIFVAKN